MVHLLKKHTHASVNSVFLLNPKSPILGVFEVFYPQDEIFFKKSSSASATSNSFVISNKPYEPCFGEKNVMEGRRDWQWWFHRTPFQLKARAEKWIWHTTAYLLSLKLPLQWRSTICLCILWKCLVICTFILRIPIDSTVVKIK